MYLTFESLTSDIKNCDEQLLCGFVARGKYNDVHKCLSEGANPTKIADFCGRTAVGLAALLGEEKILDLLLQACEHRQQSINRDLGDGYFRGHNYDVNTLVTETTPEGMSQLEWDDEFEDSDTNSLDYEADSDTDECSSLYKYYAKTFEVLSTVSVKPLEANIYNPHSLDALGMTPMHYAAAYGHIKCLKILLEHNAQVDVHTDEGCTPLHVGIENEMVVRFLLNHKADPNRKTFSTRETPLNFAIRRRSFAAIEILLQEGANINTVDNLEQTPLMSAIVNNADDIAMYLIDAGCKLNLEDFDGYTALHLAVNLNNVKIASYLLKKGGRLSIARCPLHRCIKENMIEMALILIEFGGHILNLNVRDLFGCTPLMLSIMYARHRVLEYLLVSTKLTGTLHRTDNELYLAVQYGDILEDFKNITRILILHGGIQLNTTSNSCGSESFLNRALSMQKFEIVRFLIKEGTDATKVCERHIISMLHLSVDKSLVYLVLLLFHAGFKCDPKKLISSNLSPRHKLIKGFVQQYLRNPLSLQSLARIQVRKALILNLSLEKFLNPIRSVRNYDKSILSHMTEKLDIPKQMQIYISDFDDLPNISDTFDEFN